MVSKSSKVFFIVLFTFFVVSLVFTYYDTMILKNFDIFEIEYDIPTFYDLLSEVMELISSYVQ